METLLAYNTQNTVNLETLMALAYYLKLKGAPFPEVHQLSLPPHPPIFFEADLTTLEVIKRRIFVSQGYY